MYFSNNLQENEQKWSHGASKVRKLMPESSKGSQRTPKWNQLEPNGRPKGAQESQREPKGSQREPKGAKREPKWSQREPKGSPKGAK